MDYYIPHVHCVVAHTGVANHDAIAAAKGAVAGLTKGAAATYAPHKIRINCIAPGLVSLSALLWYTVLSMTIWHGRCMLDP